MKQFNKKSGIFYLLLSLFPVLGWGEELYSAVRQSDLAEIRRLLKDGHSPDERNEDGKAPLHLAVKKCDEEMVSDLLESGANPNIKYQDLVDITPLHVAAKWGCVEVIEDLLEAGADVEAEVDSGIARFVFKLATSMEGDYFTSHTPAYWASVYGNDDIVEALGGTGEEFAGSGGSSPSSLWKGLMELLPENAD